MFLDPEDILQQCSRCKTPYGLQLQWNLHYGSGDATSGMDFTVHLKDNVLVKNKKRWSQVMYMSYTMDYAAYFHPLGMASGVITDTDVRATSTYGTDASHGPHQARLNAVGNGGSTAGWTAGDSDIHQSLQIDLGEDMVVTGVVTQGKHGCGVGDYVPPVLQSGQRVLGELQGQTQQTGDGKVDSDTPVQHILDTPIRARYISFNPVSWKDRISMRVELLGYCETDLDRDSYILATDADVKFSPQSAKALMEIMSTDPSVGAVCARTHPLGSGPLVWYQMFDYAIGHWFQKVANSVLGTVLCCPGCFSVYRCKAVRDTLATYASTVSKGEEFLTKDMGEDRWLCALMVEKGWRLEYTAVSEDSTYCPEEFDEFFNQRRRWIPSTIANQLELIRKWGGGQVKSDYVSKFFIMYQGFLLFSSMIGPSTVILIMAAGLELVVGSVGGGIVPTVVVFSLIFLGYGVLCLYAKQDTQLKWAKVLTMVFMVVMVMVLIGQAREMVMAFQRLNARLTQQNANHITDAQKSDVKPASANKSSLWGGSGKGSVSGHRPSTHGTQRGHRMFARSGSHQLIHNVNDFLPSQWPDELRQKYEKKFREHGYENTSFIFGMTNKDLEAIRITKKLHQNVLMKEIKKLPESELDDTIPENCRQWLESIGMEEYINSFETYGIISKDHLASLKSTDVNDLLKELKITKMAHIKRITNAIKKMKSPEETGRRIHQVKNIMKKVKTTIMQHDSTRSLEFKFWDKLRQECLDPEIALFSTDTDIRNNVRERERERQRDRQIEKDGRQKYFIQESGS
ncbi:MFGE8 [Branchiostoma lanceolatum]|uniref:chitin synthase n=1 Tax=Branchiostoma lanceolatum TaxID=7740 RepID=A0A8J9VCG0_BRALA|nr:MFGE8 [Branchiostoma lanceolatum]